MVAKLGSIRQTGLPVNDFGENGFDSGPAEPRFFGIRDSVPGDWDIELIGTGNGPFAINVYGIDLDESTGDRARMTGIASIGSQLATIFRLDAAATVELFPPGDYDRDGTVDAADYVVWRKNPGGITPRTTTTCGGAHFVQSGARQRRGATLRRAAVARRARTGYRWCCRFWQRLVGALGDATLPRQFYQLVSAMERFNPPSDTRFLTHEKCARKRRFAAFETELA